MIAHWRIGFNNPGFLPDPDSCWVAHTAQDALIGLIGEINNLADEEVEGAAEIAAELEEALPHFNEAGGTIFVNGGMDDRQVRSILTSLNVGELVVLVDGEAYWVRRCTDSCADA